MSGTQAVVGAGGAGLLIANYWTSKNRASIDATITRSGKATSAQITAAHAELKRYGAALIVLVVATLLAGASEAWGSAFVTALVALWLLWAINHFSGGN